MKSGFTRLQTGPSHSIWFHIHIGSFSTSHLLRWVKSKRSIMLGASSCLQIRNGLISGQDTTLVGGYLHCCSSQWSIVPQAVVGYSKSCSQCPCWTLSLSLSSLWLFSDQATWHPRYDLIVVGRYPDPKFPGYTLNELRTVDVFDGNTGEMVCQLYDPNASGIISVSWVLQLKGLWITLLCLWERGMA